MLILSSMSWAPKIALQINESTGGDIPTAGEDYSLICSVLGAENLSPIITYQWRKNNDSYLIGTNSASLSFTPARISDAGTNYSCSVTIVSSYLTDIVVLVTTSHRTRIQSKFSWCLLMSLLWEFYDVHSSNIISSHTDKQRCQFHRNYWIWCYLNMCNEIKFISTRFWDILANSGYTTVQGWHSNSSEWPNGDWYNLHLHYATQLNSEEWLWKVHLYSYCQAAAIFDLPRGNRDIEWHTHYHGWWAYFSVTLWPHAVMICMAIVAANIIDVKIILQLFLLQLTFKLLSPVPQLQWRSAGILQLIRDLVILISVDTGSFMVMERMYQCLRSSHLSA